jgi:DNA-binding transcriptional LysR family regulator
MAQPMQIKWFEDFLALATTLSFSRASELRHVTQSALSRRIQALEEWLGAKLVNRSTHPLELTRAGQIFCAQAPEVLQQMQQLRANLRDDAQSGERFLKIAASHTLASSFLPLWLQQMHLRIGNFNSRVNATNVSDAIAALSARDADLVLCYHHPQALIMLDPAQYDYVALGCEQVIPVCIPNAAGQPSYPLPGSLSQPVRYLRYSADTFMHKVVNIILARTDEAIQLAPCYETSVSILMRKMTLQGHGMAWLPESLVAEDLASGVLVRAGAAHWSTSIEIRAYCARGASNPLLRQLWPALQPRTPV